MIDAAMTLSDSTAPAVETDVEPRLQYGALPYRRRGELEILLITSRETQRWVLPKGWPMKRRAPHQAAAQEAKEEAGVRGSIVATSFGAYGYLKRLANGECAPCQVEVFPLKVKHEAMEWPEKEQRIRRWFTLDEAIAAVDEPDLKALIARFAQSGPPPKSPAKKSSKAKSIDSKV